MSDGDRVRTPPGITAPDITAPDDGTTRGSPAGIGPAMRSVSLMTAVCSILRASSTLTNECTYQERKLFELFMAWRMVKDRPYSAHFVYQPLLYLRIAHYMIGAVHERCPDGVRTCCKQGKCIIEKSRCCGARKPLVCFWVQELIVYDTMWCTVQLLWVSQDALGLGYYRLKWFDFIFVE